MGTFTNHPEKEQRRGAIMKGKVTGLTLLVVMVLFQGVACGESAVPVSPGDATVTAVVGQNCPTFSWSAADGATAYHIEVYEQLTEGPVSHEQVAAMVTPVLSRKIPAPALSWTTSSVECLSRGLRYVWYVQDVSAAGEGPWSSALGFQLESLEMIDQRLASLENSARTIALK
jgi:hypothetical protein